MTTQQGPAILKEVRDKLKVLGDEISLKEKDNSLAFKFAHSEPDYNAEEIRSSFEAVKTRVKALDSDLFFIVVFGALKAGKSTLTNLLTNKPEISPTKFGEECTMRPSIIIGARDGENEGIIQYFRKSAGNDGKLNDYALFSNVMAHLRINEELNSNYIEARESVSLDREKLGEILTKKENSVEEPLITVIRVNDSEILKSQDGVNIALIDMPGLDGKKANSDDPVYKWTQAESDFLIMVQSDFAALSGGIMEYLNNYEREDENMTPEIWVLLNKMEVTPWRRTEKLKEIAEERRRHAENRLTDALNDERKHGLKFGHDNISSVNLGKASDAHFNPEWIDIDKNPNILEDSGYPEFLNNFSKRIDNRKEILLSISLIGRLKKVLENLKRSFEKADRDAEIAKEIAAKAASMLLYGDAKSEYDKAFADNLPDGLPVWLDKPSNFYGDASSANVLLGSYGVTEETPKGTLYEKLRADEWPNSQLKSNLDRPKADHLTEYLNGIEEKLKKQILAMKNKICEEYLAYDEKIALDTENRIEAALESCGIVSDKIRVKRQPMDMELPCKFDKADYWKGRQIKKLIVKDNPKLGPLSGVDTARTESKIHEACSEDLEKWLESFDKETKRTAIENRAPKMREACRREIEEALGKINDKCERADTEIERNKEHIHKIEASYIRELDNLLKNLNKEKERRFGSI